MGTWGGVGPEGTRILQRVLKRAAFWLDGDLRAARQEELRRTFDLLIARQIWRLLDAKKNWHKAPDLGPLDGISAGL